MMASICLRIQTNILCFQMGCTHTVCLNQVISLECADEQFYRGFRLSTAKILLSYSLRTISISHSRCLLMILIIYKYSCRQTCSLICSYYFPVKAQCKQPAKPKTYMAIDSLSWPLQALLGVRQTDRRTAEDTARRDREPSGEMCQICERRRLK